MKFNKWSMLLAIPLFSMNMGCAQTSSEMQQAMKKKYEVEKTDEQWKAELSAEEYRVLRMKGTERAFTGEYWDHKGNGTYVCGGCEQPLFDSDTKFKSGTGWPSFYQPVDNTSVGEISDRSHGMIRTEVVCSRCGGHLGHVFNDGPRPTGLRYCINSESLDFKIEK